MTPVVTIPGLVFMAWLARSYSRRFILWLLERGASFLTIKIAGAFLFLVLYYSLCVLPLWVLYRGWSREARSTVVRLWLVFVTFAAALMVWIDLVIHGVGALGGDGRLGWAGILVLGIGVVGFVGLMRLADKVGQRLGVRLWGKDVFTFGRK
jgi:hypothetical protein